MFRFDKIIPAKISKTTDKYHIISMINIILILIIFVIKRLNYNSIPR